MPLPAALLARLQKRGIITEVEDKKDEVEEVFAEDYDVETSREPSAPETVSHTEHSYLVFEAIDCPTKEEAGHTCSDLCKKKYGLKVFSADQSMERRRTRMLNKYPLPVGWHEVADPDTGRFYYWNEETDKVCWLSPTHPKARITMSAEKMLALMKGKENTSAVKRTKFSDVTEDDDDRKDRKRSRKDRRRDKDDALDPMDPAAYSDVPRGDWSSGLDRPGDAKTGVDTTASGPLFQQRPYPSPGAVLRANRAQDKE